ncbi:MAG: phosphodiesterase [Actinobacteria bacterium HGW-Actinobacteria-4]|nr:MAG: phosphodiesterase [Actinobacteria bacterium HGW-Actinobacteria-4]
MSASLDNAVAVAGYYPALANAVLRTAIRDEPVRGHFVHAETTFDDREVRRHMTILVITSTRLIRVHMDDGAGHSAEGAHEAQATVESALLSRVGTMALTYAVHHPEHFAEGDAPSELVLAVGWGIHSRIELEPATCGDENCDADHGFTGGITGDDTLVRVSAIADGAEAVRVLEDFAHVLQRAIGDRE